MHTRVRTHVMRACLPLVQLFAGLEPASQGPGEGSTASSLFAGSASTSPGPWTHGPFPVRARKPSRFVVRTLFGASVCR